MKVNIFATALLFAASLFSLNISAKERKLHIVTTGDLHGAFFPVSYLEDNAARPSMMAVKSYVDSLRKAGLSEKLLDILQSDWALGPEQRLYTLTAITALKEVFSRFPVVRS